MFVCFYINLLFLFGILRKKHRTVPATHSREQKSRDSPTATPAAQQWQEVPGESFSEVTVAPPPSSPGRLPPSAVYPPRQRENVDKLKLFKSWPLFMIIVSYLSGPLWRFFFFTFTHFFTIYVRMFFFS